MNKFLWPVRVYYEDTDNGGVVYYANYLKFMERARTEWLRSKGIEQDDLRRDLGVIFAVRSVAVDYLKPALFNQQLSVTVEVEEIRKASIRFSQAVTLAADPVKPLVQAMVRIACLDEQKLKPKSIPEKVLEEIQRD